MKICLYCKTEFDSTPSKNHKERIYCSDKCSFKNYVSNNREKLKKYYHDRNKKYRLENKIIKYCSCGEKLPINKSKFCSKNCRISSYKKKPIVTKSVVKRKINIKPKTITDYLKEAKEIHKRKLEELGNIGYYDRK